MIQMLKEQAIESKQRKAIMTRFISTFTLFTLFTGSVISQSFISKANASEANHSNDLVTLENQIQDQSTIQYGDCYYDTYGNLHCW